MFFYSSIFFSDTKSSEIAMAIPNFQTIDVARIRETSPQQTSDIKFVFVDKNSGEKHELFAHKFVLAFGSEVFMTQFFGSIKEERDVILVEDASFDAFKMFLDLLYNKKVSTKETSFKLLAELFYLSDKYIMVEMQELIIQEVASRKIVPGILLDAAKFAEESVHMEKFSMSILKICAAFIKDDIKSVLEIFSSVEAGGTNSLVLHRLMAKSSQFVSNICNNCKQSSCLRGKSVTMANFVMDAKVKYLPSKETGKLFVEDSKSVMVGKIKKVFRDFEYDCV